MQHRDRVPAAATGLARHGKRLIALLALSILFGARDQAIA